jgi:two-component sensor histidine kinase
MICLNWKTKEVERTFMVNADKSNVYDFVQVSKNKWLIASQKQLIEWDDRSGILTKTKLPLPDSLALVCNIRAIIMADVNTCYITSNKGLFRYNLRNREINVVSENNMYDKSNDRFKYILLDGFYDEGIVWAASRNGLFSYNTLTNQVVSYSGVNGGADYFFFDVSKAGNNQIVCATASGISIFNTQTRKFKIINSIAGLYKPSCESVISIDNLVWIGSEVGILNYNLNAHVSERAEHETSMMQIYPSSSFTRIGDDIVFGFGSGYAYFTQGLKNNSVPSTPVIEKIEVNNQSVLLPHPTKKDGDNLVFNHSNNSVDIAFTSFLYSDPDHINFRYRLQGADTRWQYTDELRSANYAQLPPGDYTFDVQCGNKNGIWNNRLASFSFIITPPYWETWWFRTLIIVAMAFILYQLYNYRIKHILAIERIRERIASDFHDDIGSALSSISIFSEVADKQLEQKSSPEQTREIISHISFHSRAMLEAMDDIIWAVNPQNDHFNDLAVRMREFAIPLLEARNIHFDIEIQDDVLNTRVNMEARKNIFMIFKECINNILKHADCTDMQVTINKLNNQLELIITDNGKGFDVNTPNSRNGLKNMQRRAAEIKGKMQVTSRPGNGTVTILRVNII